MLFNVKQIAYSGLGPDGDFQLPSRLQLGFNFGIALNYTTTAEGEDDAPSDGTWVFKDLVAPLEGLLEGRPSAFRDMRRRLDDIVPTSEQVKAAWEKLTPDEKALVDYYDALEANNEPGAYYDDLAPCCDALVDLLSTIDTSVQIDVGSPLPKLLQFFCDNVVPKHEELAERYLGYLAILEALAICNRIDVNTL